jgi:Tfp pilus assembly protein FimT
MLFEMLITIGLIAIFIALAAKLFTTTLRLTQTSNEASRTVAAYESAVAALRRDAWGASEFVALPEQGAVRITRGDGSAVTWSIDNDDDDNAMVRREGQSVLRWPEVGAKVSVHPDPAGILVRAGEDEIRLTSELLLARKGTR